MKRLLRFLAFAAIIVPLLFSCRKPVGPDNPDNPDGPGKPTDTPGGETPSESVYTLTPASADFGSDGGTVRITVTSSGSVSGFNVSIQQDWISLESAENGVLVIRVLNNSDTSERQGKVLITDNSGTSCEFPITQQGKPGDEAQQGYTAEFTLNDGVSIATPQQAEHISAIDEDYIYMDADTPKEALPLIPSYLVVNKPTEVLPDGLMASLQQMEVMPDGRYRILYVPIGVTSAYKDLNVNVESLDLASYVTRVEDAAGNPVEFVKTKAASVENYHLEIPQVAWPIGGGMELTPSMEAEIELKLQFIIDHYTISTFNVKTVTDLTLGAEVSIASAEVGADFNVKLFSIYFSAIPVGPLVVTPAIDIYAVAGVSGKVSIVASTGTKMRMTTSVHYDELTGTSGSHECTEPENVKEERKFGPKIEGGFQYGLGIGPSVGIYGKTIAVGMSIDAKLEESISQSFEWKEFSSEWDHEYFVSKLMDIDYDYSVVTSAALHLYGFGFPWSFNAPDVKFPVNSRKLIPTISDFEQSLDGDRLTVKAKVKNAALLYPRYKLRLAQSSNYGDENVSEAFFDFDDKAIRLLEEGAEEVEVTASVTIPEDVVYNDSGRVYMDVMGDDNWLRVARLSGSVMALNAASREAIMGILEDIYSSRSGKWEGCNWFDPGVSISAMKNVRIESYDGGYFYFGVTIPKEWKLGSSLIIENHSGGIEPFGAVNIIIADKDAQLDEIDIRDDHIYGLHPCNSVCKLGFHGKCPKPKYTSSSYSLSLDYPEEVEVLDLSHYGGITACSWTNSLKCSPKKIILDECPNLESIYLYATEKDALPYISAKGCPKLGNVHARDISVDGLDLSGIEPVGKCALQLSYVTLKSATSLDIAQWQFTSLAMTSCRIPTLNVSNMPFLTQINISVPANRPGDAISVSGCPLLEDCYIRSLNPEYMLGSFSLSDCPALTYLFCERLNLQSFEVSGVPAIQNLYCRYNEGIGGEMLPVFEQMFAAGYYPKYDVRYTYDYKGEVLEDLGYGYYYSGEPERGYHRE